MKIALLGDGFGWAGGMDFLRHLANGLFSTRRVNDLKVYLLLPIENKIETPVDLLRVLNRSIKGSLQRKSFWLAKSQNAFNNCIFDYFEHTQGGDVDIAYYDASKRGLIRCLHSIGADIVLPTINSLGRDFPVPWIGYVPDFQHKYMPENFAQSDCDFRDATYSAIFDDSVATVVHSQSVKDDALRFYPETKTKIFNLPFSPCVVDEWLMDFSPEILAKYDVPEKYFIICNQFWVHKDHLTAFKALSMLRRSDIGIVCTGPMSDYRRPGYIEEVKKFIKDIGVSDQVRLLGLIPKRDQIELLKKSISLIQPTLFEGAAGGGSVYDAVSLGVPAILSDIPVNKEINNERIFFFNAGDSQSLVNKMQATINEDICRPEKEELFIAGQTNLVKLGDSLLDAILSVV